MSCHVFINNNGQIERVEAPNGEISILYKNLKGVTLSDEHALEAWAQVYTPSFKNWFGDWENPSDKSSKAVDKNGEPLLLYHGTDSSFRAFRPSEPGYEVIYFTPVREYSEAYAERAAATARSVKQVAKFAIEQGLSKFLGTSKELGSTEMFNLYDYIRQEIMSGANRESVIQKIVDEADNGTLDTYLQYALEPDYERGMIEDSGDEYADGPYDPEDDPEYGMDINQLLMEDTQKIIDAYDQHTTAKQVIADIYGVLNRVNEARVSEAQHMLERVGDQRGTPTIMPVFVSVKNPEVIAHSTVSHYHIGSGEVVLHPKSDGLIGKDAPFYTNQEAFSNVPVIGVKSPNQVKSVFNEGPFNPNTDDIFLQAQDLHDEIFAERWGLEVVTKLGSTGFVPRKGQLAFPYLRMLVDAGGVVAHAARASG